MAAWLVIAYTLPLMIFMPLYGRLGDGLGKTRLLLLGLTIFLIGTVFTLTAINSFVLIIGRGIQGVGAAAINPLGLAIISEFFPAQERGWAMGTWASMAPIAATIGPLLAGFLIDYLGWRAIFGPVLLVGAVALLAVHRYVPKIKPHRDPNYWKNFDWAGVILLVTTVIVFVFYVSSRPITGVTTLRDWRLLTTTAILLASFIIWEARRVSPFIRLSIFKNENFSRASLCAGIRMFTMSGGITFLIPLYLTDIYAYNAATIGLMITIHSAALLLTTRVGGQLADRWKNRWPVVIGTSVQAGLMVYFALLSATILPAMIVFGIVSHGLGAGLSLAALHRTSMLEMPLDQTGVTAGMYGMIRFSGTVLGTALAGVILQQGLAYLAIPLRAYQMVFWFLAGIALIGVAIAYGLQD